MSTEERGLRMPKGGFTEGGAERDKARDEFLERVFGDKADTARGRVQDLEDINFPFDWEEALRDTGLTGEGGRIKEVLNGHEWMEGGELIPKEKQENPRRVKEGKFPDRKDGDGDNEDV